MDIKPDNILIYQGYHRISDMGVSKTMNPSDKKNSSLAGCGTPAYTPPESGWGEDSQAGNETLDTVTMMTTTTSFNMNLPDFAYKEYFDVYCLGVSIIQLINNELPDRLKRKVKEERKKYYDPRVLAMIERMVAYKPEDRLTLGELEATAKNLNFETKRFFLGDKPTDKIFEGLGGWEAWRYFHDLILKMTNDDESSNLKYDDDKFSVWKAGLLKSLEYNNIDLDSTIKAATNK